MTHTFLSCNYIKHKHILYLNIKTKMDRTTITSALCVNAIHYVTKSIREY